MTSAVGTVATAQFVTMGDELAADALIGTTVLPMSAVMDFDEDGGQVLINGTLYSYTSADPDAVTVTLAGAGLTAAASEGDRVDIYNPATSSAAVEMRAFVTMVGDVDNTDPVDARVSLSVAASLPEGIRADGAGEPVQLEEYEPGQWRVTDLLSQQPNINGALIATGSVDVGSLAPGAGPDPLAALIQQNGQCVDAPEDTSSPGIPSLDIGITVTIGLVWHDITSGGATEGDYFVFDGTTWVQITVASTLALCAGLRTSQSLTVPGTKLYAIYPDPLSNLITPSSVLYTATSTAPPTGTYNSGDLCEQTDTATWWVYTQTAAATGTWADWTQVTYPATIQQIQAIVMSQVTGLISQAFVAVANDIATGNTQNIPSDLNHAASDILAAVAAQFQPLDIGLSSLAAALDGATAQTNQVLYITDVDSVATAPLGALALELLTNVNTAADGQAAFSVTDEAYTGTAAKISAANFLATYQTARGTI